MSIRNELEKLIVAVAVDKGIELSQEELKNAANGVQYWFDETVWDSIDTALSNVVYDREEEQVFAVVKFYMRGDESGELYTKELMDKDHYQRWMSGMDGHIEVFSTKIL
jgi:hypothetical protein